MQNSKLFSKYSQSFNYNKNTIRTNQKINSLTPYYFFSKFQINDRSLSLLNTYFLKNDQLLIFNQIGLQLLNEKKIYTFGIGHRKYFYNKWTIGNNLFYDTLTSQYNGKVLSIGNEFFKDAIYMTINTYYDTSVNNFTYKNHKKYIPHAYDIHIKYPLPFFSKIYGKINIEYYFNNKNYNYSIPRDLCDTTKNVYLNSNKLTIGIIYLPISIFTFNINKVIYDSIKTHNITFNVTANYVMNIPWIYQKKYTDTKHDYYKKIYALNNNYSIVERNNSLFYNEGNTYTSITQNMENAPLNKKKSAINTTINENSQSITQDKTPINLKNITLEKEENNDIQYNTEHYEQYSEQTNHSINTQLLSNDNNSENNLIKETIKSHIQQQTPQSSITIQKSYHDTNNYDNIPPPPPISTFLKKTQNNKMLLSTSNKNNDNVFINTNAEHNIENINIHKKEKFSSIGSTEHLLKLNNITKKRKKTISTSSNDSNDSESSMRLLKIIERQSALTIDNDTDSDEKSSITSNNDFSE